MDPPDFRAIDRRGQSFADGAAEEVQLNGFFRVLVPDDLKWNGNVYANVQFFEQLTLQAFLQRFSLFLLAAGKFPETGEVHTTAAFCDEIPAVVTDQSGRYFDDFGHERLLRASKGKVLQIVVIGHPWHEGVRAVQQVAPKSMSA